jgi:hypothetical protein
MEPLLFLGYGSYQKVATSKLINLADNNVQQWKSFKVDDDEYDFGHLNARKQTFQHPSRDEKYILYFTFSHHVFTRSVKINEEVDAAHIYPYPSDQRVFDKVRFTLSKYLPDIVETLPDQFCYHGGYGRYCTCKIDNDDGTKVYYQVVYRVWKKRGKMRCHIESAYPLEKVLGKKKKVDFWVICYNLLHGKRLPLPPKYK